MFISNLNENMYKLSVKIQRFNENLVNMISLLMYFNITDRRDSIVANMWLIHFVKRVYEVIYVHNYTRVESRGRFLEWVYFNGFGYLITTELENDFDFNWANKILVFIWGWSEMQNHICHLYLAQLPNDRDEDKSIPYKGWFKIYTAPNYTFELLSWACFTLVSGSKYSMLFTLCSGYKMYKLANRKKLYYQEIDNNYNNFILIPTRKN